MNNTYKNKHNHDYLSASGALPATLKNDLLFHYILQKSKPILKNLVCSLKGLAQEDIKDVIITNPIDYAEYTGKQIIILSVQGI